MSDTGSKFLVFSTRFQQTMMYLNSQYNSEEQLQLEEICLKSRVMSECSCNERGDVDSAAWINNLRGIHHELDGHDRRPVTIIFS